MNELVTVERGAHPGAIIPRSIDEMWRVAKMVCMGGIAPASLVEKKQPEEAISAVCAAIMSGAELGLPPMVALRSFTVINGKPALYGDGLINVVRRSGRAEYIRTGYDRTTKTGWCEARRRDTGEGKREEFSVADALHAGLFEDKPTVRRKSKDGGFYEKANDAPWYRYPQRMTVWRAAGYCLRDLFADVLGGMPTTDELEEVFDRTSEALDISPPAKKIAPPPPPPVAAQVIEDKTTLEDEPMSDALAEAIDTLDAIEDPDDLHQAWSRIDPGQFSEPEADTLKAHYYARLDRLDPNTMRAG